MSNGRKNTSPGAEQTAAIPILALSSIYTEPRTNETRVEHANVRISKRVKRKRAQRVGSSSSVMNTLCPLSETTISDKRTHNQLVHKSPTFGPKGVHTDSLKISPSLTIVASALPNTHLDVKQTLQTKANTRVFDPGDVIK
jgi:hypothetical protein